MTRTAAPRAAAAVLLAAVACTAGVALTVVPHTTAHHASASAMTADGPNDWYWPGPPPSGITQIICSTAPVCPPGTTSA